MIVNLLVPCIVSHSLRLLEKDPVFCLQGRNAKSLHIVTKITDVLFFIIFLTYVIFFIESTVLNSR